LVIWQRPLPDRWDRQMEHLQWVCKEWSLDRLLGQRLGAYLNLWVRRHQLDQRLLERLGDRVPLLQQRSFAQ
ncbi:hypothetical protein N8645_01270, partial [bacterium]|nr:hypothetical protein [bacterium]